MFRYLRLALPMVLLVAVVGCAPDYSPNTYSTAAVQQANKVDQGVIAGFRQIEIKADGTVGAVAGGAAGGVLGAQEPDGGVVTALSAIGGTLVGGLIGTGVEHATNDTKAFEYLVRKPNGELLSLAQKDATPLPVGLKVLVIEGKQARIVADYSVPPPEIPAPVVATTAKNGGGKSEKTDTATVPAAVEVPQPTPAATHPAAEPHAADTGSTTQSAGPPAPAAQADQTSAAQPTPSAPASQQPVPAPASPPAPGHPGGGDQAEPAPPASGMY